MTGIYGIYNSVSKKWYVGQAQDIDYRNQTERRCLSKGRFHWGPGDNQHLASAWGKYGPEAFFWVVLEECAPEQLDEREQYWIEKKNSYAAGYNQTLGGGGRRGYHLSDTTKKKLSKKLTGLPQSAETRARRSRALRGHAVSDICREATRARSSRPIVQILEGGREQAWQSATAAAAALGLQQSNITKCCRGKLNKTGGAIWRYAE